MTLRGAAAASGRILRSHTGSLALLAAVVAAFPAGAQEPPPFAQFTFRRVAPPPADAARRITVQIPPVIDEPASAPPAAAPSAAADAEAGQAFGWFWRALSPTADASGAGRIGAALEALARAPAGQAPATPALGPLAELARAHGATILAASAGRRVSPALVLAVIATESGGRANAVSPAGARGLMQLMPATAARFGVRDIDDPGENIRGGVAYLDWLMESFGGDPLLVLAAYNAGETAVRAHGGVPPFAETRAYVPKVLAGWQVARRLCQTPPELISDPCALSPALSPRG